VRRATLAALAALLVVALACRKEKAPGAAADAENRVAVRAIQLFYESPDLVLVPETRSVALPENAAGALSGTIRELLKGSANASIPRLFPPDTILRGAYLLPDGTALVDIGGPTLSAGWTTGTHQELMAAYSVVETVMRNFNGARRVRLLVNGEATETLAGHLSLRRALTPNPSLVDIRSRGN
jgi:hypothetical protein